jgi:H+/Na+-translocating ferredoxin:NAD+ oxidoreductase subunit B
VATYEKIRDLIVNNPKKALTTCFCRHHHELLGDACDRPKDVCMVLGPFSDFAIERGYAKPASDEEMLMALDRAEESGVVHLTDNITEKINFVCNCCACCCGILGTVNKFNMPNMVAHSNYIIKRDEDSCIDCGECVDRCQMFALKMDEETDSLEIEMNRCIGCGACIRSCEQNSLSLVKRPEDDIIVPHESFIEMGMAVVQSMHKNKK